jgi:hypothetical protein
LYSSKSANQGDPLFALEWSPRFKSELLEAVGHWGTKCSATVRRFC